MINEIRTERNFVLNAEWRYYDNINPDNITSLKSDFYSEKNIIQETGIVLTSAATFLLVRSIIKVVKRKKPTYTPDLSSWLAVPTP